MADDHTDPGGLDPTGAVPEADRLEQQAPLDPELSGDDAGPDGGATTDDATTDEADAADRWEQQQPVGTADEEYPHDRAEDG